MTDSCPPGLPNPRPRHEDSMSTKSETSWMPANGSHPVTVGSSLAGALKANKGLPQAPKLSDRGFYSFRCTLPSLSSRSPLAVALVKSRLDSPLLPGGPWVLNVYSSG